MAKKIKINIHYILLLVYISSLFLILNSKSTKNEGLKFKLNELKEKLYDKKIYDRKNKIGGMTEEINIKIGKEEVCITDFEEANNYYILNNLNKIIGLNNYNINNDIPYEKLILPVLIILSVCILYIPGWIICYLFFCFKCCCFCIRTGIYGGSFNPIHNGHIALARQMLEAGIMDEVWFVVSPLNPFKKEKSDLLSDKLRLEMTSLALENEPGMMAQDFEFYLPKPSYTWQTLQAMSSEFPNREFILMIGADNWQLFHKWYKYQEILDNYSIVIYPRDGINIDIDSLPKNVKFLNSKLYPISSTQVRKYIKEGKLVDDLIPKKIIPKAIQYYKGK